MLLNHFVHSFRKVFLMFSPFSAWSREQLFCNYGWFELKPPTSILIMHSGGSWCVFPGCVMAVGVGIWVCGLWFCAESNHATLTNCHCHYITKTYKNDVSNPTRLPACISMVVFTVRRSLSQSTSCDVAHMLRALPWVFWLHRSQ
jgi:hypothetical protein